MNHDYNFVAKHALRMRLSCDIIRTVGHISAKKRSQHGIQLVLIQAGYPSHAASNILEVVYALSALSA